MPDTAKPETTRQRRCHHGRVGRFEPYTLRVGNMSFDVDDLRNYSAFDPGSLLRVAVESLDPPITGKEALALVISMSGHTNHAGETIAEQLFDLLPD